MNKAVILNLICMLIPLASYAQSNEEIEQETVRIEASQLAFANGTIFANLEGQWVPVDAIYSGGGSILAAIKKNPNIDRWICSCRYNNNGWDRTCQREYGNGEKCGLPRPW